MSIRLPVAVVLVLAAAGCGGSSSTTTVTVTRTVTRPTTVTVTTGTTSTTTGVPACAADGLTATFTPVRGSAAAGQISYSLRLTNASSQSCSVSGIPSKVQLLDEQGGTLPTNPSPAVPGQAAPVVTLAPGDVAAADVRFSPDIPGGSEPTDEPCEPKAYTILVTIEGGIVEAAVKPPTSVCERGSLSFRSFAAR